MWHISFSVWKLLTCIMIISKGTKSYIKDTVPSGPSGGGLLGKASLNKGGRTSNTWTLQRWVPHFFLHRQRGSGPRKHGKASLPSALSTQGILCSSQVTEHSLSLPGATSELQWHPSSWIQWSYSPDPTEDKATSQLYSEDGAKMLPLFFVIWFAI